MDFIQKNVNTKLLLLLLGIVAGIAGLTIYYQENFLDINAQYQGKVEQLNKTFNELTYTKNIINKTKQELELKTLREEDLSGEYLELKDVQEETEAEKEELEDIKTQLDKKLLDTQRSLVAAKYEISDLEEEVEDLKSSSKSKSSEIDRLQSEVNRLKAQGCS